MGLDLMQVEGHCYGSFYYTEIDGRTDDLANEA